MTDTNVALIDVLICTYRRPELLLKALDGVQRCAAKVGPVRVVVVDNDSTQSARAATLDWASRASIEVSYRSQPKQNIALTRNMALDSATAPWIALLDDDEVPDPDWLASLLDAAQRLEADVVFGPIFPIFDDGAPEWATKGTVFQRKRFPTGTVVALKEARTGNALLRNTRLAVDKFRFDPLLGLSGGEDSEFFSRLSKSGYRMIWCDEACVSERMPMARTKLSWIVKRFFRVGSVEAYNRRRMGQVRETVVGAAKFSVFLAQGLVLSLFWAPFSSPRCVKAMTRAALGAGFYYGLLAGPYREYSTPAAPPQGATS